MYAAAPPSAARRPHPAAAPRSPAARCSPCSSPAAPSADGRRPGLATGRWRRRRPAPRCRPAAAAKQGEAVTLSATGDIVMGDGARPAARQRRQGLLRRVKRAQGRPGDGQPRGAAHRRHRRRQVRRRTPATATSSGSRRSTPGTSRTPGSSCSTRPTTTATTSARRATRTPRQALEEHGLKHTGAPDEITVVEVKGVKVAVVGFSSYAWSNSLIDLDRRQGGRREGRRRMADLVVVQVHMGAEGAGQDPGQAGHRDVPRREPGRPDAVRPRRDRRRAPTWSSGTARTCCAAWSSTRAG